MRFASTLDPTSSHDGMRTACVIPVRGGSKGIPRKNLAELVNGFSLLSWTVRQALQAFQAEDVIVSTEDAELANLALANGARVIPRPERLAQDESTTASVVEDLLDTIDAGGRIYNALVILQVTSPLRELADVRCALNMMATGRYDSVVSAFEEIGSHPAKMYTMDGEMAVSVMPAHETCRRQDLPPVFRRNGAIFAVTTQHFRLTGRLWGGRTGLVLMPRERSTDIDTPADLENARRYLYSSSLAN